MTMFGDAKLISTVDMVECVTVYQYVQSLSQEQIVDYYSGPQGRIARI